jgi:hypothetical protein
MLQGNLLCAPPHKGAGWQFISVDLAIQFRPSKFQKYNNFQRHQGAKLGKIQIYNLQNHNQLSTFRTLPPTVPRSPSKAPKQLTATFSPLFLARLQRHYAPAHKTAFTTIRFPLFLAAIRSKKVYADRT